jgi:hypothetical protein
VSDIEFEPSWYFVTGEVNTDISRARFGFEPRLGLDVLLDDDGHSRLYASAGMYRPRIDPRAMAELIGNDGGQELARSAGDLGGWPVVPTGPTRRSLTLAGSRFDPPRTLRVEAGMEQGLGRHVSARLVGTFRHTSNLLSRRDANTLETPWGTGPGGRPVLAPLIWEGGVIGAEPGSWFYLPDADRVWRLDGEASSRYTGVTAELRYEVPRGLRLVGRYTFSRTRDDWHSPAFPAHALTTAAGFGGPGAPEEGEGISDFDIPHRAVGEATLPIPIPGRPEIALLYTVRSGTPFTPIMGYGIDADGNGVANDRAFIDPGVPGIGALTDRWSCLAEGSGSVAERNSCRSDMVHRLDAAATLRVLRTGSLALRLRIEALGVLDTGMGVIDAGLYQPTGAPVIGPGPTVDLPLEANVGFGSTLLDPGPVRSVRIGAELTF